MGSEASKDLEHGNKTSKQAAELKNQMKSDYHKSLSDRIKEGLSVKSFHAKKKVDFGRVDKNELRHRQKTSKSVVPGEKYHKMVERREQIKKNTNKINCFVDESQPAFINTMSRTMDAYDIRMSTFGGSQAKYIDKSKAFD